MSREELTFISYSVLTLIGRGGASAHDLVRMVEGGGRVYRAASPSQYYAEPKRLERLGYLSAEKAPGRTRERTVYRLTDKGAEALRAWAATPTRAPHVSGEPIIRMLAADIVGERATRASLLAMRDELGQLRAELDEAEVRAETLPHRTRYLLLNHRLARRVLDVYEEWLDEVERALR